jgi:Zn finger protein HypA/HybF involved in hydrogenase expression
MSNFWDLINIEEFEKRDNFIKERWEVSFYCKDCRKLVKADRPNTQWYKFLCPDCKWERIVLWTEQGLKTNYKIK